MRVNPSWDLRPRWNYTVKSNIKPKYLRGAQEAYFLLFLCYNTTRGPLQIYFISATENVSQLELT